jgi:hypothetical protein
MEGVARRAPQLARFRMDAAFPLHELMLVGSSSPIELDGARIGERYSQPALRSALAEVGIESPEALLATWLTDRAGLERFAGDAFHRADGSGVTGARSAHRTRGATKSAHQERRAA